MKSRLPIPSIFLISKPNIAKNITRNRPFVLTLPHIFVWRCWLLIIFVLIGRPFIGMAFSRLYYCRDENGECISGKCHGHMRGVLSNSQTPAAKLLQVHIPGPPWLAVSYFALSKKFFWHLARLGNLLNVCQEGILLVNATQVYYSTTVQCNQVSREVALCRTSLEKGCIAWISLGLAALPEGPKHCSGTSDFPPQPAINKERQ